MTMGENPGYRLRGVEVKGVSHSPTNAIKHNPAQIITDAIFLRGRKILREVYPQDNLCMKSEVPSSAGGFVGSVKKQVSCFKPRDACIAASALALGGLLLVTCLNCAVVPTIRNSLILSETGGAT